mmetsp:Transcript_2946/g.6073  ORF Transcript_2946/g.6073 Transcript_2946/m.6073 type:complete len:204 (-) Transcript_2946:726-1337(-)
MIIVFRILCRESLRAWKRTERGLLTLPNCSSLALEQTPCVVVSAVVLQVVLSVLPLLLRLDLLRRQQHQTLFLLTESVLAWRLLLFALQLVTIAPQPEPCLLLQLSLLVPEPILPVLRPILPWGAFSTESVSPVTTPTKLEESPHRLRLALLAIPPHDPTIPLPPHRRLMPPLIEHLGLPTLPSALLTDQMVSLGAPPPLPQD